MSVQVSRRAIHRAVLNPPPPPPLLLLSSSPRGPILHVEEEGEEEEEEEGKAPVGVGLLLLLLLLLPSRKGEGGRKPGRLIKASVVPCVGREWVGGWVDALHQMGYGRGMGKPNVPAPPLPSWQRGRRCCCCCLTVFSSFVWPCLVSAAAAGFGG